MFKRHMVAGEYFFPVYPNIPYDDVNKRYLTAVVCIKPGMVTGTYHPWAGIVLTDNAVGRYSDSVASVHVTSSVIPRFP